MSAVEWDEMVKLVTDDLFFCCHGTFPTTDAAPRNGRRLCELILSATAPFSGALLRVIGLH